MCTSLNALRVKQAYKKHKGKGSTIKRRNLKDESEYGKINSELLFWRDVNAMKPSIELIQNDDIIELSNQEILGIFKKYSTNLNCELKYNGNSQFLRLQRSFKFR